jgi:tyrosyl-tRNA synthetase
MTLEKEFERINAEVKRQLTTLCKGTAEVIPGIEQKPHLPSAPRKDETLGDKIATSLRHGKPLRVYLGVDPTAPDIHLGHTVVLRKLKHFQDLGHTAIFLIGDFSAMIGDPTGQSETRPPLTREQVDTNAKTYLAQVFKLLDPKKTEVRYNSEWLGKLSSYDVVRLCGHYRLARMLEREDFRSRLRDNQPISVHELLYPLLTAYDAVELQSDVEIGATEQKLNLLVHRDIQREYGLASEVALTMPILVGLDGQRKMSKSLGNYVGITEPPDEMFGKIMSISDDSMWIYIELLTDKSVLALQDNVRRGAMHPFAVKSDLAESIVRDFYGPDAALQAAKDFRAKFSERQVPESMKEIRLRRFYDGTFRAVDEKQQREIGSLPAPLLGKEKWTRVLAALKETESASEAERLIKGGGFEVNGEIIRDPSSKLDLTRYGAYVVRIGKRKRYFRLVLVVE